MTTASSANGARATYLAATPSGVVNTPDQDRGMSRSSRDLATSYNLTPVDETTAQEVNLERIWRERCGEPKLDQFPIRCRRDLNHPDGHAGLASRIISEPGERPMRWETWIASWPGPGNEVSAKVGNYRCWCSR